MKNLYPCFLQKQSLQTISPDPHFCTALSSGASDQIWQGSGALQHITSEIICKKSVADQGGMFVQTNSRSHLLFTTEYESLLYTSTPLEKKCDAFWMHAEISENLHSI